MRGQGFLEGLEGQRRIKKEVLKKDGVLKEKDGFIEGQFEGFDKFRSQEARSFHRKGYTYAAKCKNFQKSVDFWLSPGSAKKFTDFWRTGAIFCKICNFYKKRA